MATNQSGLDHLSVPVAILIASVIVAAAVMLAGARIANSPGLNRPAVAAQAANTAKPAAPARVGDIKQVKTTNNPIVGAASAPIVIATWVDYQCPVCQRFERDVMAQVKRDYIDTGKIRVVHKDLQFLGPDSVTMGTLGRAVWQLAPDKYAAWNTAVFENQGREHSGWATPEGIKKISEPVLGVDLTAKAMALAQSNKATFQARLDADRAEGANFGISATPSMIIGDKVMVGLSSYATVKAAIDAALAKK